MSKITLTPNASGTGTFTVASPNSNTNRTLTLPDAEGNLVVNTGTGVDITGTLTSDGLTVDGATSTYGQGNASLSWGDTSTLGQLSFDGSANPVVRSATGKALVFQTNGPNEAMRITSSGNVGIGIIPSDWRTQFDDNALDIGNHSAIYDQWGGATFIANNFYRENNNALIYKTTNDASYISLDGGNISFSNAPSGTAGTSATFTERMRIDSSGRVAIGGTTVTDAHMLNIQGSGAASNIGVVLNDTNTSKIYGIQNGGSSLKFYDYSASTERMRIDNSGNLLVNSGNSSVAKVYAVGQNVVTNAVFAAAPTTNGYVSFSTRNAAGTQVGYIYADASGTAYNTNSDYRLKENVVELTGATDRLKQLNPSRFNFIVDSDKTIDGFLAHEVQDIVPEAVTGAKDAMRDEEYEVTPAVYEDVVIPAVLDDEGNELEAERTEQQLVTEAVMGTRSVPDYQGIDQSKLVPLLTAALQEALTEISDLKARVVALEAV